MWNAGFSLQSVVLKFTKWYQIQRTGSQREGGRRKWEGSKAGGPAESQRGDGHLLRINSFTRGRAGDICWLFALDRGGQEVSALVVPRDPERPQPSSRAPRAAAGACSGSPGAALRFPEFHRRGLGQAPGQPPARGPAPRKQRNQNRLELPGLLFGDWTDPEGAPRPAPPPALLRPFPQSEALRHPPPPNLPAKKQKEQ